MRRIALALILLVQAAPALAGAWTQVEGRILRIEKFSAFIGGSDGVMVERYLEFGVTHDITLITTTSVSPDPVKELGEAGRGSVAIALRQNLFAWEGFVMSAQSGLYLPRNPDGEGFGDAEYEHRAALGWGGSILGTGIFANVEAGLRTDARGLPAARLYDFSLGQNLTEELQLISSLSLTERDGYDMDERREQVALVWSITEGVSLEAGISRTLYDSPFAAADEEGLAVHVAIWQRK